MYLFQGWATVCDDSWGDRDARVVCRMLGQTGGTAMRNAIYGQGTHPIGLDEVGCTGNEEHLFACRANNWGDTDCSHSEDAGVRCTAPPMTTTPATTPAPSDGDLRLSGGTSAAEGRLEWYINEEWHTICDDWFHSSNAAVVCRQLGFTGGNVTSG